LIVLSTDRVHILTRRGSIDRVIRHDENCASYRAIDYLQVKLMIEIMTSQLLSSRDYQPNLSVVLDDCDEYSPNQFSLESRTQKFVIDVHTTLAATHTPIRL
jgi:hypothetical protein